MGSLTFEHPDRYRNYWVQPLIMFIFGVVSGVGGLFLGDIQGGLVLLVFLIAISARGLWKIRQAAEIVTLFDNHIEARNYGGKCISLQWDQISDIRSFKIITGFRDAEVVRLMSSDRRRHIVVSDLMPGFDDLMKFIQKKTSHAHVSENPNILERLARWA